MKESLKKYLTYCKSESEFTFLIRINGFVWYEEEYQYMLELIRNVLNDYENNLFIPKRIVYFFGAQVPRLVGTMRHPNFILNPPIPYTEEEYEKLIKQRIKDLLEMKDNFFREEYDKI